MKSIRGRLMVSLLSGLTAVLLAGSTAVYWIAKVSLTRQFDAGLKARAHTLTALVKLEPVGLVFETSDAPAALIAETHFELRTPDGRSLKRSPNHEEMTLPVRNPGHGECVIEDVALPGLTGRAIWLSFQPRVDPDDWQGRDVNQASPQSLILIAALERETIDRALGTLVAALWVVGASVGVAVAVMVVLGVSWGLKPLDRLRKQLARVEGESLSDRLDAPGVPTELVPIYQELNSMLERVGRTFERERSFADAAAHELRSPLTELRTLAEIALRWPDPVRALDALRQILAVGREMECLVESLLVISRGTVSDVATQEVACLHQIVGDCVARLANDIQAKRIRLQCNLEDCLDFEVSAASIEIIVRNLLDNAVRYTPPEGIIEVRHDRCQNPTLIVENGPVHLTDEDVPHLFQPFWQKDRSRSDREHVGLGLTVVERISRASGLQVEASLVHGRLRIRLATVASTGAASAAASAAA